MIIYASEYGITTALRRAEGIKVILIVPWDSYYGTLMDAFSGTSSTTSLWLPDTWLKFCEDTWRSLATRAAGYHPEDIRSSGLSEKKYQEPGTCIRLATDTSFYNLPCRRGKLLPEATGRTGIGDSCRVQWNGRCCEAHESRYSWFPSLFETEGGQPTGL